MAQKLKSIVLRLISLLLTIWVQIRDLYLYFFRRAIIVNGYVDDHSWRGIRHRNWGDDLNYYFLRELTRQPVVMYHNFKLAKWLHLKNYLCIGTLLDAVNYSNAQTIVWGSGVSGQERSFVHPDNILAVRGPKTKGFCDRYGVQCPEVYGDPALLLPLVYKPEVGFKVQGSRFKVQSSFSVKTTKAAKPSTNDESIAQTEETPSLRGRARDGAPYRLGIIPHVVDLHHPVIEEIRDKHPDEILIIDLAHYEKWTDVIDQICSCERILSSSLHGLIVSDVYQVPSCWIELSGKISGGYFKFVDYAFSVGRDFSNPLRIEKFADIANVLDYVDLHFSCADAEKVKELQQGLIKVAPFKLTALQR